MHRLDATRRPSLTLPEQCSGSTLCVFGYSVPAIHGATSSPSFNTGPAILGRSFAPARAMLELDAARRPSLTLPEQCSGSTLCVFGYSVPAIHGATSSPSFNTGPAILGRSFAPARAMLELDAARRPSLTLPEQCSGSTLCVFGYSVPAIHGATSSPSFNTGPAILGRSFAPARAMLELDAARRPSLTLPEQCSGSTLCVFGYSVPAIHGATSSPSFNTGPAILGRSFAPARAMLELDAARRPSLTLFYSRL